MTEKISLPEEGYIRLSTILKVYPIGKSTWYAGVKSGRFEKPTKLGPRTNGWTVRYIRSLIAAAEQSKGV